MTTFVFDGATSSKEIVEACVKQLNEPGAVLLLPTETVYGLVCRWSDDAAKKRIYALKDRDESKPFQMMISSVEQLEAFDVNVFPSAKTVTETFCPGPITILIPHDGAKVGYRIPDHELFLQILSKVGEPLAATSANLSGDPLALTVADATNRLNGTPDIIVDAGKLPEGAMASTVVDVTPESFSIVRPGPITEQDISNCLK